MKITEITETGYYWNRLDEFRDWTVVQVVRVAKSPEHPSYNKFTIGAKCNPVGSIPHNDGDFIGPIPQPTR